MDEREELERFLKRGASEEAPSSSEKEELDAFLAGGDAHPQGAEQIQVPTLGQTRQAAERKTSPRARRAASLVQQIEGGKRRAVDLFRRAEEVGQRDPGLVATHTDRRGLTLPTLDSSTNHPYRQSEALRARAEAELEIANRMAEDARRGYSDLVEAGFGDDTDPRQQSLRPEQRRRWAYVKPKSREVRDLLFTRRLGESSDRRTERGLRSLRRAEGAPSTADGLKRAAERRDLAPRLLRGEPEAEALLASNLERVETGAPEDVGTAETIFSRFMRGLTGSAGSTLTGASMAPLGDVETAMGMQLAEGRAEKARGTPVSFPRPGEPEVIAQAARDAEQLREWSERTFPVDPLIQPSYNPLKKGFWAATLPEAAGSTAPMIAAGALSGPAAPYTMATMGATQNAGQTYADAKASGASDEEARAAAGIGALIGTSEAFGLGRTLAKLGLARPALRRVGQIVEEYGQEAGASWANELNAAIISGYDPTRDTSFFSPEVQGEGLVGAIFGVGAQGLDAGARRLQSLRGARSVRAEQATPLDLTPTTIGPTGLVSLREAAAKPEFRKRLDEANEQARQAAASSAPESAPVEAPPAPVPAQAAPVEDLHQALRSSVESAGKLPRSERGTLLDQVFEAAVARGAPRDAATLDKAVQLAGQGAEAAKSQFNQAFPVGGATAAQPAAAPADDLAAAVEGLKSLRKPTEAEAKEAAEEAKKQAKQAGKEFEKQAKRAEKETEKEARLDEQAAREAEGEIKRMRLYDEAVGTAQSASEEAETLIEAEDFSTAIGKLRAQQSALGQSVKHLPETPEAVKTRTAVAEVIEGINTRIPELRKQSLAARRDAASPSARAKPTKVEQSAQERRQRAETGQRVADRYREQAQAAMASGRLLEAHAAFRAELQALNDVMRITPVDDVGRRTQIRNSITAAEREMREVSGSLKKGAGKARQAKTVDEDAPTADLEREEAEYYARLAEEGHEAGQGISETAPLAERPIAPVREATPARRPTERRFVSRATAENIEELKNRRGELSRLRYDRSGEFPQDLADEFRELGSRIVEFEIEQARVERGGRLEDAPPPGVDKRPYQPPTREDMRKAFDAVEARLTEEATRAVDVLPRSDTEALDRSVVAVNVLFGEIEQDVDALDLLDRAIEGDTDAREELIHFAGRSHGVDADTIDAILDARRFGRESERGHIRKIAQARAGQSRAEAGPARHGEDRETQQARPQTRALTGEGFELLGREPAEVSDEGFDRFLQSLETLNNDRIRGLVGIPEWATRQLEARLKQANEIRRGRVKEKRLGAKNAPLPAPAKPLSKTEGGQRLVEQVKGKKAGKETEEAPTVVHPNPEIDREPILAETNRGTVIVSNPANKTGVSEVKDRSDEPAEHKFSSTQINLPPEVADQIIAFGRRIPEADLADDGRETEPHITIKYGLHGWDPKFAEEALKGEKPAAATFGKVSLFETNPDFDVVKVDVVSEDLRRLNKKISDSQPNTETHPTYRPHVTVAYVKKGKGARYVGNTFLEGKTITLDSVTFSGRDGERVEIPLARKQAEKAPKAEAKEPWQMTAAEWRQAMDDLKFDPAGTGGESSMASRLFSRVTTEKGAARANEALQKERARLTYGLSGGWMRYLPGENTPYFSADRPRPTDQDFEDAYQVDVSHERVVRKALSEGNPVPAEVLKDYPDLSAPEAAPKPKIAKISLEARKHAEKLVSRWTDFANDRTDFKTLIENSRVEYRRDPENPRAGVIYLNSHARRLYELMLSGTNNRDESFVASAVKADNLPEHQRMTRYFMNRAGGAAAVEWALSEFDEAITSAIGDGVDGAIFFDVHLPGELWDWALSHESFHVWQFGAPDVRAEWIENQPGYNKLRAVLLAHNYEDDPVMIAREWAAYAVMNNLERFGLTEEEGLQFLDAYFDEIVNQGGVDALDRIGNVAPKPREIIERKRSLYGNLSRSRTTEGPGDQGRGHGTHTGPKTGKIAAGRSPAGSRDSLQERAASGREGGSRTPDAREVSRDQPAGRVGAGSYLGSGLGSLQPLLERGAGVLSRRSKVPIPEDFDINKYIDGVIDALGEAQNRGVPASAADKLTGELTKLVEAVGDNDGWAVVDAHKRIAKTIGSRAPDAEIQKIDASVWEKLSALRKAGLLARVPTHVRNILGNTIFQQMEEVTRMPAAMADMLISLGTKRRTVAGPSASASARAIGKAVTEGGREAVEVMKKGLTAKQAEEQQLRESRFRNPVLDAYLKYVFRALSASDAVFFRGAYDRAISERARLLALNEAREGLIKRDQVKEREKELRANPDLDTQLAATEDARIAVFRNDNKFGDIVSGIRGKIGSGGNFAVDTVMPFDRTPSNLIIRTLEYTPLGYGRNVIQLARAAMNREFTPEQQRVFAQTFGRATTGTFGVMLLGYVLAARGLMTGFYDEEDDEREAVRRAAGRMPASIRLSDRWFSVGGLAPLGTLLALGATVHREWHEDVKDEEDRPLKSLRASSKFVFDLPLMRGTKEVYEAAKLPGSLGQKTGRIAASFVPAPVADVGTLSDEFRRETGTSLKGFSKMRSEFGREIAARLPVAREYLPPKVDVFGEPIETEKGHVFDPFASRRDRAGERGLEELLDLDIGLSKPQREAGETAEEYNARVRERGQKLKQTLGELSDDENVRGASRDARRAVYERSLDTEQMERAGKLSSGSVRVERQIEALRGEAYAALRSIPEYERLSANDQKTVRDLINEELKRFKAEAAHVSRGSFKREKRARVPDWTPEDLARAAVEAKE